MYCFFHIKFLVHLFLTKMNKYNVYKGQAVITVLTADSFGQAFDMMKQLFSGYESEDPTTWSITMLDGTKYSLI